MNAPVRAFAPALAIDNTIEVTPSSASRGAEISGVDLREDLNPITVAQIRAALLEHKVLVFRDQDISHDDHVRFARYFGDIEGHPVTGHVENRPEILSIKNGEYQFVNELTIPFIRAVNKWHADVTFREAPALGAVLRARTIPPRGGDTLFADTTAAYADLPPDLRARLDTLTATHDILKSYGWKLSPAEAAELTAKHPPQSHPVVRVHPETGEKSLFVNHGFTTKIDGLGKAESDELLALLFERVRIPEYQVRIQWTPNTVLFWDNRATQHYPVADYWPAERAVERVTIVGDKPVGPV